MLRSLFRKSVFFDQEDPMYHKRSKSPMLLILFLLLLASLAFSGSVSGADFQTYYRDGESVELYDKDSVNRFNNVVGVWTQTVMGQKMKSDYLKGLKFSVRKKFKTLDSTKSYVEINCEQNKHRLLNIVFYDRTGKALESQAIVSDWKLIVPNSIMYNLYQTLCKK
jgi:hypothetical protein